MLLVCCYAVRRRCFHHLLGERGWDHWAAKKDLGGRAEIGQAGGDVSSSFDPRRSSLMSTTNVVVETPPTGAHDVSLVVDDDPDFETSPTSRRAGSATEEQSLTPPMKPKLIIRSGSAGDWSPRRRLSMSVQPEQPIEAESEGQSKHSPDEDSFMSTAPTSPSYGVHQDEGRKPSSVSVTIKRSFIALFSSNHKLERDETAREDYKQEMVDTGNPVMASPPRDSRRVAAVDASKRASVWEVDSSRPRGVILPSSRACPPPGPYRPTSLAEILGASAIAGEEERMETYRKRVAPPFAMATPQGKKGGRGWTKPKQGKEPKRKKDKVRRNHRNDAMDTQNISSMREQWWFDPTANVGQILASVRRSVMREPARARAVV